MADKHYLREELYELVKKDERIFDFIQEGSLDGLWYWDLENPENEWMNDKFWKVLGYDAAEMPHKPSAWQGIINPDDLKIATDNFHKHLNNPDHPYDQEVRYTHKDGSTVWVRCRGIAIRDDNGTPLRMLGAHQDITELKKTQTDLSIQIMQSEINEKKYKAIYNNTPMAIQSLDFNGNIIEVNEKWLEIMEYPRDEVIGHWFGQFLHPDYIEHFRHNFPEFKKAGSIKDVQFKLLTKTGKEIFVSFDGCIGYNPDGNFEQTYCTFKDITKEKEARAEIEVYEERYRSIFESAGIGVGYYDTDGVIVDYNSVALKSIGGLNKEDVIGKTVFNFFPFENAKIYDQRIKETIEIDDILEFEDLVEINERKKWFISTFSTVKNTKGKIIGVQIISLDVTKLKEYELQLTKKSALLEKAEEIADFGSFEMDINTGIFKFSSGWKRIHGVKDDSLSFDKLMQIAHPDDFHRIEIAFKNSIENKKNYKLEHRIIRQTDKEIRTIKASGCVMLDNFGATNKIYGSVQDITDSINASKSLEESIIDLELAQEIAGVGYWKFDPAIGRPEWSAQIFEIYECNPALGTPHIDDYENIFEPEQYQIFNSAIQNAIRFGIPYDIELKLKFSESKIKWIRSICRPDKEKGPGGHFLRGTLQDITSKKIFEQALRESEVKYRFIAEKTSDLIIMVDKDGNILYISPNIQNLTGYSVEEYNNFGIYDNVYPDDKSIIEESFNQIKSNKRNEYTIEIRIFHQTGRVIWIQTRTKVIRNIKGEIDFIITTSNDITERKEAEMALKSSEARHKQLIETASDAIYMIDENGIFIDTNRAAERMLKMSRDNIIGYDIGTIDPNFPVEDFKKFWEMTPLFEQRIFETTHQDKDGKLIPVEVSGQKFTIENKIYFYGIARDITERKKAIMAIRESEAKFKGIFDHANIGIATATLIGPLNNVNRKFEKLLGYSKDELLNMTFRDFTHPDDIEREVELVNKMINGNIDNYEIEKRYIHKDGSAVWVDLSIAGMKGDNGEYILFIGMANDITEKKKAQEKTKILAEMLDTAPNSITVHDEQGRFLYANEKTYLMHGYTPEEYMQLSLREIDSPESAALIDERVKLIKNQGSAVFEVEHLKKDGSRIPLEVYVKLVSWLGKPALLSVATDISERKNFISELIEAKERAEESDRLKSAFLANMSHEIRTPMNSILGFTNLLTESFYSMEEKNHFISLIRKSGERLISTINDLIDISRIESGEVTINKKPVNINEKIDDITEMFINEAAEKGLKLIPAKTIDDSKVNIITDEDKLYSILINLVKNSIKYTREGQIVIGYKFSGDFIEVFVSDTGIGIPKNRLDKIFDRFVQADLTYTRPFDGSGLGLAITKSYVEMLGGRIWVKSEEGKGSTFFFTLPNIQPEIIEESPIVESRKTSGTDFKNLKLLIADDEENVRYYFKQILKNHVKEIIFAKTGKEALEIFKNSGDINLIIMDLKMPELNGFDATREIRKFDSKIHIIAQTAFALEGDREKALEAGCNDYISKPINKEELIEKIKGKG